jgi:hypothetical protein
VPKRLGPDAATTREEDVRGDASMHADRYFASGDAGAEASGSGSWHELRDVAPIEFVRGLKFRPILGRQALVSFITYAECADVPRHAHEEEQITFLLQGEVEFEVGKKFGTYDRGSLHSS